MVEMRKSGSRGDFVLNTDRSAIGFGLPASLVQVMREQCFAFAAFIKRNADAKHQQANKDPNKYFHAFNLGTITRKFKLEASPC